MCYTGINEVIAMEPFVWTEEAGKAPVFRLAAWERRMPGLSVGFTSRIGGVSQGCFETLNCGLHVADNPDHVVENRRRIAEAAGFDFAAWTIAEQVHGDRVAVVGEAERGRGRLGAGDALPGCDAMVTDAEGVVLTACFADCVPLFFLDVEKRVIGIAHAGWKGTTMRIAERTVETMRRRYGSRPESILAAIGPSIGGCCYEVDERVLEHVRRLDGWESAIRPAAGDAPEGRRRLDLKELNRKIMIKAGVLPQHIESSEWCTSCRTDLFFSHRKEKGTTGRMAGWIGMRKLG
jgi:hypothetical protein